MATKRRKKSSTDGLPIVHRHAAGIDIGATFHVVAVTAEADAEPVRKFRSFTGDLCRLADWLQSIGITTIAMESTGVYWIPVFEVLEQRGFEVLLVNARDVKMVPGRKTDFNDAQWLQRLHQYGLLRGSFRPREKIATLRSYLRHREGLVEYAASHIQHMQKALMQMNVQLHHVLSDITGATGMKILRAIVGGERDPSRLAEFRDPQCKASVETVREALTGNYRAEHVFALRQALELFDFYQTKIAECDREIEQYLVRMNALRAPTGAPPKPRQKKRARNEPKFDIRTNLYSLAGGTDLTQIHGLGPYSALRIVGECGTDMSRWPSAKHFTSWLTLAPAHKITGGKILSSRTRKSASRAAAMFRTAAIAVGKSQTALGAFSRRLASRAGKAKAVTATARKIAVIFYNTLRFGAAYVDPGADYYEQRFRQRTIDNLRRRAKSLGLALVEAPPPQVGVS